MDKSGRAVRHYQCVAITDQIMGGNAMLRLIGVALVALPIGSSIASAEELKLPPLKKQPSPQAVIDESL
jgi:hypothetical protein